MWSGGIRVVAGQRCSAEALIETSPAHSCIDIIVRGEAGSERECAKLLFELTEETQQRADDLSPGSQLELFYLSRMELDELSPEGLLLRPCVEYSEESVLQTLQNCKYVTDGKASRKPEDPRRLLPWFPVVPLRPLAGRMPEAEWRIVLLRLAKAINTFDQCTRLADALSINERGEDVVLQFRSADSHQLPPAIAMKVFERWLRLGACELPTESRQSVLNRLFCTDLCRADLCEILQDELSARLCKVETDGKDAQSLPIPDSPAV